MMYGFKARFVPPILAGTKTGTIRVSRVSRVRHARAGDGLQLKSGSRFRPVVFADTICTQLLDVTLIDMGRSAGRVLVRQADGFADWDDLCRYWWDTHRVIDFLGSWIRWAGAKVVPR